jgi:hypothetical protein
MKNTQNGFGAVGTIVAIAVVVLIGLAGWKVYDSSRDKNTNDTPTKTTSQQKPKQEDSATSDTTHYDTALTSTIGNFDTASESLKKALINNYYAEAKKNCDAENAAVSPDARLSQVMTVGKMVRDDFAAVQFCGSGGSSILAKVNGDWAKIGSLSMAPACKLVDQYKISKDITSTCYEENDTSRAVDYP